MATASLSYLRVHLRSAAAATAVGMLLVGALTTTSLGAGSQGGRDERRPAFQDAVGSWFGRAIPVPGMTICPAGAPGCPVPPEIVMVFTINADGTFVGIDSNIFAGGNHTTAHGQWERGGPRNIRAEFTLLQSAPNGVFIGGFKNLFSATVTAPDEMNGGIDAYLYAYTNPATGAVIVDADGFPTPSPLDAVSECSSPGCTHLGQFSFKVRRVKVH